MNNVMHKRNGFEKGLLVLVVAMSFWLGSVASGLAAPMLTFSGTQLTGATGLNVGGTLYNLTLMDGTCVALFDGCDALSDFPFPTLAATQAAYTALADILATAPFTYISGNVIGCTDPIKCALHTPYGFVINVPTQIVTGTLSLLAAGAQIVGDGSAPNAFDFTNNTAVVYGKWAIVPEPTTMMLLSTGLLGLVGYRWRQGRREGQQVG